MPVNSFDHYPLTWKPDLSALKPPYYLSLAADLEKQIRSGSLSAGTKLPPQREIADYLDLNYTTITRVYELLKQKGLLYGVVGKGTFVAPHAAEDVTLNAPSADACIEMGPINGFGEYATLVEKATRKVVEKGYLKNLYEYSFPTGQPHQLAAGVRWMQQMGIHTDVEHTALLAGAQNALTVSLLALFSPGDKIAADFYTYPNLIELAGMLHLVLVPIPGDADGMNPEELDRQCKQQKIRGIYLIPTLANPTNVTIPLKRRKQLADVIRRHDLILIEDDISSWLYAVEGRAIPSFFDLLNGQSICICTTTKSLCGGLRVAFMTFAEAWKPAILHSLQNTSIKTSALDAEIITELILNGDAYEIAVQKKRWAQETCQIFAQFFPCSRRLLKTGSYYQWLPLPECMQDKPVEEDLLQRGVRVYQSSRFAVHPETGAGYLRISLCSSGSKRLLKKGLAIIRKYLQEEAAH